MTDTELLDFLEQHSCTTDTRANKPPTVIVYGRGVYRSEISLRDALRQAVAAVNAHGEKSRGPSTDPTRSA